MFERKGNFIDFSKLTSAQRLAYLDGWAQVTIGLKPPVRPSDGDMRVAQARNVGAIESHVLTKLSES